VGLNELQDMPDLIGLTALDSLTIEKCGNFRPRGIAGAPRSGRRLDQRDDARLLARAAAKGGGVCQRSGMHVRLGATSGVSWLDEQVLDMIADEVLGGWGLLKEWRQELVASKV